MTDVPAPAPETSPEATPGEPAIDRSTPWREAVIMLVVVLTPPVAYLASLQFAVLLALGGLLAIPLLFRSRRPMLGLAYLAALAAWALMSMGWSMFAQSVDPKTVSPEDVTGAKMFLELGLYSAFASTALGLSEGAARRTSLALMSGVLALAVLFAVEGVIQARAYNWIRAAVGQPTAGIDFAIRDVSRVGYVLALLFWPTAVRLMDLKLPKPLGLAVAAGLAVATAAGATLLRADAPTAALLVSAAVFAVVLFGGRRGVWACLAAAVLYFAAAPLLIHALWPAGMEQALGADPNKRSWAIRLDIWRFATERILERPAMGWGLDASRAFSPGIQLHPHNAALQIWLELGAVGAALMALFWAWVFGRIDRLEANDRLMAAAAAATATVYLTIGALSFGVWQEWWIALGALSAAGCIMGARARRPVSAPESGEPAVEETGVLA